MPLSNRELGNRIGVSPSMASRIRNGHRRPGVAATNRIHRALGIPLAELHQAYEAGPQAVGQLVTAALDRSTAQWPSQSA